ncbi:ATP-binding protein [Rhodocaloribacter sp.]
MKTGITQNWVEDNQRALTRALGQVKAVLTGFAARRDGAPDHGDTGSDLLSEPETASPSALDALCRTFGLSPFERAVLVLCTGMELDASFAGLCAACHDAPHPTFGLALAVFPEAHWSALAPDAPLRHWRMIELRDATSLTRSPLHVDERILHYLTGLRSFDEQLSGFVHPLPPPKDDLVPSHRAVVEEAARVWAERTSGVLPVLQLCGGASSAKRDVAAAICTRLGLTPAVMAAHTLPQTPHEFDVLVRLWEREAILGSRALALDCETLDAGEHGALPACVDALIERLQTPLLVLSSRRRRTRHRAMLTFMIEKPEATEQRALWAQALGETVPTLNGRLDRLAAQFNLSAPAIRAACVHARASGGASGVGALWDACRLQARPHLDDLAQRIPLTASWDDLVLPERQLRTLRTIALHVRHRMRVYETWGFARKSARGLGISALFTGQSGTGKTMAAEVLARELRLDLYRIDLSSVVSKYIGETEKNLRRVFDAAEEGGAILLFDEADALFGKRTEIKDSHDRYANIEVSYLLQRMETYRGLAILTSNLKDALDDAFQRRIRFIVTFPFPDTALRARIWQRIFPEETPTRDLDEARLARLTVTGGHIRNIAMNAAFFAAEAGEPVRMRHVLQAAMQEYAKLDKPLTDTEIRGWT